MKAETYDNKNKLEFNLYEEIPENLELSEDERNKLKKVEQNLRDSTFFNCKAILRIMKKTEDNIIGVDEENEIILIEGLSENEKEKINVNEEYILYSKDNEDRLIKIEKKILNYNPKLISEIQEHKHYYQLDNDAVKITDFLHDNNLNLNEENYKKYLVFLKEKFEELKAKEDEIEKQEKEKEELDKKAYEEKHKEEIEGFKSGVFEIKGGYYDTFKVNGKTIKGGHNEIIFKKNVNKLFTFEELKDSYKSSWGYSEEFPILRFMSIKKVDFEFKSAGGNSCAVTFEGDKHFINKARVRKEKFITILKNLGSVKLTEDNIKIFNKLSIMKYDLLKLKELDFNNNLKIPVQITLIDADNFTFKFMGVDKSFTWDKMRELFYYNGTSRHLNRYAREDKIIKLSELFEVNKKDMFSYLKKLKVLRDLNNEDDD